MFMSQPEADQGFGLLKDIVEMVKNPKAIDEAYEARRKAAELTDDEVKKSGEARALIKQADDLRDEIAHKESLLEASRIEHSSKVAMHTTHANAEIARLKEWEDRLISKESQLAQTQTTMEAAALGLKQRETDIQSGHVEWEARYNQRIASVAETETAQKAEQDRLTELRLKLRAKAQRLSAEAEKDD